MMNRQETKGEISTGKTFAGQTLRAVLSRPGEYLSILVFGFFVFCALLYMCSNESQSLTMEIFKWLESAAASLCVASLVAGYGSSSVGNQKKPMQFCISGKILLAPLIKVGQVLPLQVIASFENLFSGHYPSYFSLPGTSPSQSIRSTPRRPGAPAFSGYWPV